MAVFQAYRWVVSRRKGWLAKRSFLYSSTCFRFKGSLSAWLGGPVCKVRTFETNLGCKELLWLCHYLGLFRTYGFFVHVEPRHPSALCIVLHTVRKAPLAGLSVNVISEYDVTLSPSHRKHTVSVILYQSEMCCAGVEGFSLHLRDWDTKIGHTMPSGAHYSHNVGHTLSRLDCEFYCVAKKDTAPLCGCQAVPGCRLCSVNHISQHQPLFN